MKAFYAFIEDNFLLSFLCQEERKSRKHHAKWRHRCSHHHHFHLPHTKEPQKENTTSLPSPPLPLYHKPHPQGAQGVVEGQGPCVELYEERPRNILPMSPTGRSRY